MPIINKGTSFSNGEQLTADKINDLVDLATFNQNATDSNTTTVNTTGQIVVNSGGISAAQLATDAVETANIKDANVTFSKMTDVIDDGTMATATNTTLATSESIKTYVNSNIGIVQCKLGTVAGVVGPSYAVIPADSTVPLISEGVSAGFAIAFTPTSTANTIRASLKGQFRNSSEGKAITVALFEDSVCVGVSYIVQPPSGYGDATHTWYFNPSSTDEHIYTVRFGTSTASYPVNMGMPKTFGGFDRTTLFLEEIPSALFAT
tara:strand:- start:63 stop:851 length:789 start_codon:yes stop_codon:yes gene_type:complete